MSFNVQRPIFLERKRTLDHLKQLISFGGSLREIKRMERRLKELDKIEGVNP